MLLFINCFQSNLRIIAISAMFLFPSISFAEDLTADRVLKEIVGSWRLLSFERDGKLIDDYSDQEVIWRFKSDNTMSLSDKQLGTVKDNYKVVKSRYGWMGKGGILILIMELKKRGFSHPKFVVRGMTGSGYLILGDWDDTLLYRLKRVE
ncbi:hypothetical protein ACFL0H_04355 [Thermodesulfobacteriota bacterium]